MSLRFTLGGFYRISNAEIINDDTFMLLVQTGGTLGAEPIPFGMQTILRVSAEVGESVFDGDLLISSTWNLRVEMFDITTFLLTEVLSIANPWFDPAIGLTSSGVRYSDITAYRLAVAVQTSTALGGDTYAADGSVVVYVNDAIVAAATGLTFARGGFGAVDGDYITNAFGNLLTLDRVWGKIGTAAPSTDASGALLDTTGLLYYDDFPGGDLSAWQPYPDTFPYVVSSVGGANGYGLSYSTAAVSSTISGSGPFQIGGIIRLVEIPESEPEVEPPSTHGCPVAMLP